MPHNSFRTSAWAAGALALALAACVGQQDLVGPRTEAPVSAGAPLLKLTADTLALRQGDRLSFRVDTRGSGTVQAEIFLVDSARTVLWRSGTSGPLRDSFVVTFSDLPGSVAQERRVFLTGALVDPNGRRVYATRDTVAAASLTQAALQPTIVYQGRLLPAEGEIVALVAARELGRVYFADRVKGTISVVDLATLAISGTFAAGAHPEALAYARGHLGVLSDNGAELAAFDVAAGNRLLSKTLMPPLVAVVGTPAGPREADGSQKYESFRYQVRPYARNLALTCVGGAGCPALAALGSSELIDPLRGSVGTGLRELAFAGRTGTPFLVAPRYNLATISRDSFPATFTLLDASVPAGSDSLVYAAENVGRCAVLNSGGSAIAASPHANGSVYVGLSGKSSDCPLDVPLVRVDNPDDPMPAISPLAFRNLLGEDRIRETRALDVSEDGSRVLVLDRDRVHVLDDALRVRASLELPGVQASAWLREDGPVTRFAVVTHDAVEIYGMDLVRQGRIVLGKLSGMVAFARVGGATVIVVVPADAKGVLVARIPLP